MHSKLFVHNTIFGLYLDITIMGLCVIVLWLAITFAGAGVSVGVNISRHIVIVIRKSNIFWAPKDKE